MVKERVRLINQEQKRQIEVYKWSRSEQEGRDLADEAIFEWITKYAASFRKWVSTIPFECKNCGLCSHSESRKDCHQPLDEERLKRIKKE
jgi:hypothetical protein